MGLSLSEFGDQFQPGTDLNEEDLRMIFKFLDVDGSNTLSTAELMSGLDGFVPSELPELARLSSLEKDDEDAAHESNPPAAQTAFSNSVYECTEDAPPIREPTELEVEVAKSQENWTPSFLDVPADSHISPRRSRMILSSCTSPRCGAPICTPPGTPANRSPREECRL